jgi:cytochrome P450
MVNSSIVKGLAEMPVFRLGRTDRESFEAFQNDPITFHLRAFRKLGPAYRTWFGDRMQVVLAGPEANDFIWKNGHLWSYAVANALLLDEMGDDHVPALDGAHHLQKRTVLKAAFDQAPARRFLPQFNAGFREALDDAAAKGSPVDLILFWTHTITRINTRTVARADMPDDAIPPLMRWQHQMLRGQFLDDASRPCVEREEYRVLKAHAFSWLYRIVDERLANPGAHDDNFEATLRARSELEGGKPDRDRLANDLYLILVAGTENTANFIRWATVFAYTSPKWLGALRAELQGWDGADIQVLAKLPVLKAILMETLRVGPRSGGLTKHCVRDFEFGGYTIPAGTDITYPHVLGHFMEEFYPEPFTFNPARFLDSGRFVPRTQGIFGGGTHICLGRNHTLMQSPLALAQLVKHFDLEFARPPVFDVRVGNASSRLDEEVSARLIPCRG